MTANTVREKNQGSQEICGRYGTLRVAPLNVDTMQHQALGDMNTYRLSEMSIHDYRLACSKASASTALDCLLLSSRVYSNG
jgi:hypothetical protein